MCCRISSTSDTAALAKRRWWASVSRSDACAGENEAFFLLTRSSMKAQMSSRCSTATKRSLAGSYTGTDSTLLSVMRVMTTSIVSVRVTVTMAPPPATPPGTSLVVEWRRKWRTAAVSPGWPAAAATAAETGMPGPRGTDTPGMPGEPTPPKRAELAGTGRGMVTSADPAAAALPAPAPPTAGGSSREGEDDPLAEPPVALPRPLKVPAELAPAAIAAPPAPVPAPTLPPEAPSATPPATDVDAAACDAPAEPAAPAADPAAEMMLPPLARPAGDVAVPPPAADAPSAPGALGLWLSGEGLARARGMLRPSRLLPPPAAPLVILGRCTTAVRPRPMCPAAAACACVCDGSTV